MAHGKSLILAKIQPRVRFAKYGKGHEKEGQDIIMPPSGRRGRRGTVDPLHRKLHRAMG